MAALFTRRLGAMRGRIGWNQSLLADTPGDGNLRVRCWKMRLRSVESVTSGQLLLKCSFFHRVAVPNVTPGSRDWSSVCTARGQQVPRSWKWFGAILGGKLSVFSKSRAQEVVRLAASATGSLSLTGAGEPAIESNADCGALLGNRHNVTMDSCSGTARKRKR